MISGKPSRSPIGCKRPRRGIRRIAHRDTPAAQSHLFGTCRDYALLLCSMLRHRSIPARVRCGFAHLHRRRHLSRPLDPRIGWSPGEQRWRQARTRSSMRFRSSSSRSRSTARTRRAMRVSDGSAVPGGWRRSNAVAAGAFGHARDHRPVVSSRQCLPRPVVASLNRQMSDWDGWRDATPDNKVLKIDALAELDRLADMVTAFENGADTICRTGSSGITSLDATLAFVARPAH